MTAIARMDWVRTGWVLARLAIGGMLLFSGWTKLSAPYENFLAVILIYEVVKGFPAEMAARILPWAEVLTGLFLVVGHRLKLAAASAMLLFGLFIAVVGQALIRQLEISECGCFGEAIHLPPKVVYVSDLICLGVLALMIRNLNSARFASLDAWQSKNAA